MILKGSTLVFSLIVLAFLLVSALSVAAVAVTEKRASLSSDKSNISFQAADSGAEAILEKIYKGSPPPATPSALGSCSNGVITGNIGAGSSGSYTVSLYDNNNAKITCNSPTWRTDVVKLKSEGRYANTTRAIEVAIAYDYCTNWSGNQIVLPSNAVQNSSGICSCLSGAWNGTACV